MKRRDQERATHSPFAPRPWERLWVVAVLAASLFVSCGGSATKTGDDLLAELERVGLAPRGLPTLVFATSDP